MEEKTPSQPSNDVFAANEDEFFNLPVVGSTIKASSGMSIEEMLKHFEPIRREWMKKYYNAEARRAGMNPERFVM